MGMTKAKAEVMRKRAFELYEEGLTLKQIAERTGYSYTSVIKMIRKHKKGIK